MENFPQKLDKSEQTIDNLLLKRKFKKKYVAVIILSLLIIISVLFYGLYLKKVTIYEPLTISISGLTYNEQKSIEIYSTTPLNRKTIVYYSNSEMVWLRYYSFIKSVDLIIPDTLRKKITGIEVYVNDLKFNVMLQAFPS